MNDRAKLRRSKSTEEVNLSKVSAFRYSNLGRDRLLEDFARKFQKTRNLLRERNEQCIQLANEIQKNKLELIQLHEVLQNLEKQQNENRDSGQDMEELLRREQNTRKLLLDELSTLRKLKQERQKEIESREKEYFKVQNDFTKVYDEHIMLEKQARKYSKQLQDLNQERMKYKQAYLDNMDLTKRYSRKLKDLRAELQDMKSFVSTSIETLQQSPKNV